MELQDLLWTSESTICYPPLQQHLIVQLGHVENFEIFDDLFSFGMNRTDVHCKSMYDANQLIFSRAAELEPLS